jgi:hypothetical protein
MKALMFKIAGASGVDIDEVHKAMGIKHGMSPDEVKKAKRKYALNNHPDRNPGKDHSHYTRIMSGFDDHYDSTTHAPKGRGWRPPAQEAPSDKEQKAHWEKRQEEDRKHNDNIRGQNKRNIERDQQSNRLNTKINVGMSALVAGGHIGGQHLHHRKALAKGNQEEADLHKKIRNRQVIGQGVGYLAGALIGNRRHNKRGLHSELKDAKSGMGHTFRDAVGEDGTKKFLGARRANAITGHGFTGQSLGSIIGHVSNYKAHKRLQELKGNAKK